MRNLVASIQRDRGKDGKIDSGKQRERRRQKDTGRDRQHTHTDIESWEDIDREKDEKDIEREMKCERQTKSNSRNLAPIHKDRQTQTEEI